MKTKYYLLDFDETLVTSTITWGLEHSVPKLIQKYDLNLDEAMFSKLVIEAIKRTSAGDDVSTVAQDIFVKMNWQPSLYTELLNDVMSNYKPRVFDDVLPFLTMLRQAQKKVVIVSNNPRTAKTIPLLNLSPFFDAVVTPMDCMDQVHKPDIRMWDCVQGIIEINDLSDCLMIGDDPWSDAEFALRVGINYILVDRKSRFTSMPDYERFQWVKSLKDIAID